MQLSDIKSRLRDRKSLRDIINRAMVFQFYPPPVSEHYKLLRLKHFMDTLTSLITTAWMLRIKSHELYDMLHHTCGGILHMKIFHWLCTPYLITIKNTAYYPNFFKLLWINQWMDITRVLIDHVRKWQNILQKTRLIPIIYVYIIVKAYMQKLLHTPSYKNATKRPSYTSFLLLLRTIVRATLICSRQTFIISFITNQAQNHRILYYHVRTYISLERWLDIPWRQPRT